MSAERDLDPYLAGLRLAGRRVVIIGAGAVATRRLPRLLEAGAVVEVIAPTADPEIQQLTGAGEIVWTRRPYAEGDLAESWYVLAATDDPDFNAMVSAEAERCRVFCVRADDRHAATAWTPASAQVDGMTIGVLAGGDPRRARRVLAALIERVRE